jgi:hypothetical protein
MNGKKPRVGNDSGTSVADDVPHCPDVYVADAPRDDRATEAHSRPKTRIELRARVRLTYHTEQYQAILRPRDI